MNDGWISIDERLPDSNDAPTGYVLAYLRNAIDPKLRKCVAVFGVGSSYFNRDHVRYWCAIPALPNELNMEIALVNEGRGAEL